MSIHPGDCWRKWSRLGKLTCGINHAGMMVCYVPKERIQFALIIEPTAAVLYGGSMRNRCTGLDPQGLV